MPKVLVSNNSELLRHFTAPPFQRLGLELLVAKDAADAQAQFTELEPAIVILDAELGDELAVTRAIKRQSPATRVILVAGRRLSGDQMRAIAACGCDELLIAPMTADELHDVVAIQLGEPRLGTEGFAVAITLGTKKVDATVSNLSVDGVRLVVAEPVAEGQAVEVKITPDGEYGTRDPRHRGLGAAARWQDRRRHRVHGPRRARAQRAREAHAVAGRQGRRAHARRVAR